MDEKTYPKVVSDRKFTEWIKSCPLQVKRIVITKPSPESSLELKIHSTPCGEYNITSYSAKIELLSERKEKIGEFTAESIKPTESDPIQSPYANAVYANAKITSVEMSGGEKWENTADEDGTKLPEQEIFWQTDPLYEQIKLVCAGIVDAKYKPDTIDGGWRCACGQVNRADSEKCGSCHTSKKWLDENLDESYLRSLKTEADSKSEKQIEREVKRRREKEGLSDKAKALIALSAVALVAALTLLTVFQIIPSVKYSGALKAVEAGEFDKAIAAFTELDDFRDSKDQLYNATYKKAQSITGLDEVYMTTTAAEPWFQITSDGVLSFRKDDYTGSWNNFVIPDVVDGIMVRELERNFFINCKEMTVVTISDCVEVLGEQVFYNCESLHTVNFGKSVSEIGPRAFINCTSLEEIEIPDTVQGLGLRAFNNCINLKKVILGSGITKIGSYQFSLCMNLEQITLKSPITEIDEYAFSECTKLENIFCRYPESDWTEPEIAEGNECWSGANISFDN